MAKRRTIQAPSADDLKKIEAEFRDETKPPSGSKMAPIAQVAGDAASHAPVESSEVRADAAKFKDAETRGLLIREIPLDQIDANALVRDRMVMIKEELDELRDSISRHGLRMPIEVFETGGETAYGLLSGYRRLHVVKALYEDTELEVYSKIRAVIRDPQTLGGAINAMVEENEIRASLSHFERGRIAVIAAQQGGYGSTEEAVADLFKMASKAKRSKVRSFALIFEELGDLLEFPELLKEKDGLRVAAALRNGAENRFRDVLAGNRPVSADEEWGMLEQVCEEFEGRGAVRKKGGRPKIAKPKSGRVSRGRVRLESGLVIERFQDGDGHMFRVSGAGADDWLMDRLMEQLRYLLEKPDD